MINKARVAVRAMPLALCVVIPLSDSGERFALLGATSNERGAA